MAGTRVRFPLLAPLEAINVIDPGPRTGAAAIEFFIEKFQENLRNNSGFIQVELLILVCGGSNWSASSVSRTDDRGSTPLASTTDQACKRAPIGALLMQQGASVSRTDIL